MGSWALSRVLGAVVRFSLVFHPFESSADFTPDINATMRPAAGIVGMISNPITGAVKGVQTKFGRSKSIQKQESKTAKTRRADGEEEVRRSAKEERKAVLEAFERLSKQDAVKDRRQKWVKRAEVAFEEEKHEEEEDDTYVSLLIVSKGLILTLIIAYTLRVGRRARRIRWEVRRSLHTHAPPALRMLHLAVLRPLVLRSRHPTLNRPTRSTRRSIMMLATASAEKELLITNSAAKTRLQTGIRHTKLT